MSWFYAKHGKQQGPVDEPVLRSKLTSGEVSPDDLVWREGMPEWKPAREVAELAAPSVMAAGAPPPSSPGPGGEVPGGPPPASAAPASAAFAGAAGSTSTMGQPAPGVPMIYTPPPTSGLAIASMVCGIIALLSCYMWAIPGIPAVICGHMALARINRSTQATEGRGMAIAGLITGYLAILIQILAIIGLVFLFNSKAFE